MTRLPERMARWISLALVLGVAVIGGVFLWQHTREPKRNRYVLINETGSHDFDLALRMSLKLAEKKSGIENALILLPALPEGKTIEATSSELFSEAADRCQARRPGNSVPLQREG